MYPTTKENGPRKGIRKRLVQAVVGSLRVNPLPPSTQPTDRLWSFRCSEFLPAEIDLVRPKRLCNADLPVCGITAANRKGEGKRRKKKEYKERYKHPRFRPDINRESFQIRSWKVSIALPHPHRRASAGHAEAVTHASQLRPSCENVVTRRYVRTGAAHVRGRPLDTRAVVCHGLESVELGEPARAASL